MDLLALLAAAVALEAAAVRRPEWGYLPVSAPLYLYLLTAHPHAAGLTLLVAALGGLLRSRGEPREALAELPGLVLAAGAVRLAAGNWRWLLAIQAYALTTWLVRAALAPHPSPAWRRLHASQLPLSLAGAASAPLLALEPRALSWPLELVMLWSLQRGALALLVLQRERERTFLERHLDLARRQEAGAREELQLQAEQLAGLERLTESLAPEPDAEAISAWLAEQARRAAGGGRVAIVWPHEPRAGLVEEVYRTGQPAERGGSLAWPLGGLGVLTVEPVGEPDRHGLSTLALQATAGLHSALYFRRLQTALRDYAHSHERLERWSAGLQQVVALGSQISGAPEPAEVLGRTLESLQTLVGVEHGWVLAAEAGDALAVRCGDAPEPPFAVAREVLAQGRALWLGELAGTRFEHPELRSLLAVPLEGAEAVALVGSPQPVIPDELTAPLATLLGCVAGAAYLASRSHQQELVAAERVRQAQAQTLQAGKMAAVGQLAAGLAHELNTPLGAVMLALQYGESALPPEQAKVASKLATARKAAHKCQELIEKLLVFSRSESRRSSVDLERLARDTLELVGTTVRQRGVRLETRLEPAGPLQGCATELQQVITNLVLNAADAVAEQKGTITVRTGRRGERCYLEVEDDGPGVAPEHQNRIFEPFYTTKPVGRGVGLGLSLSHDIALAHEGELTFETRPGRTVFRLLLEAREGQLVTGQ